MCFANSQPAPPPPPPSADEAIRQREEEAKIEAQRLRQKRAIATGIRTTLNPATGFLGVDDEPLAPTENTGGE